MSFELDELNQIIREATQTVEDELALEDQGWIRGGVSSSNIITEASRKESVQSSRLYWLKDPLCKQAIRLWTDYTFGTGMTWSCEDKDANKVLSAYWNSKANQSVLSSRGQRRSSDKLLIDGELFFALFLGKATTVRLIDPLEITDIITDPDDKDDERYYKREWSDAQGGQHTDYYCSHLNPKDEAVKDSSDNSIRATNAAKNVLVYHLPYNTIGQRGYPLLLPALDWVKQYRRFLASRVAVMLALARFAWKTKLQGGMAAVAEAKVLLDNAEVPAGSVMIENKGADTQPIRTDSGAAGAYQDGRQLKLQVAAAVGIPEQYFGDISIGNLATAKTVELPMMKMFQSYQQVWADAFKDMDEIVLEHNGIDTASVTIDRDFPKIAPEDVVATAQSLQAIMSSFPQFSDVHDVLQVALMSLGINNTSEILAVLDKKAEERVKKKTEMPIPAVGPDGKPLTDEQKQFEATVWLGKNLKALREILTTK